MVMSTITVGIREFKNRLSSYLEEVKDGNSLVITDRGKPVGRVIPEASSARDRMLELAQSGYMAWNGRKPHIKAPRLKLKGKGKTMSDLIVEGRR
jgi:prevent-host-death family protein